MYKKISYVYIYMYCMYGARDRARTRAVEVKDVMDVIRHTVRHTSYISYEMTHSTII